MRPSNGQQLPEGWTVKTIEEVAEVNPRLKKDTIPSSLYVSFVPMPAVGAGDGTIDVSHERPFSEVKKGFTPFQGGDVLFAKITPCMENGKMAVVPKLKNGYGFGSTEFHVLRPKNGLNPRYLYYYISNKSFRAEAQHYMTGAVGQKRVSTAFLKECKIPLAPPDQQESIVAEIEKQFSRLDEAVANLKRVKANLKRYKAAVLKAAVEGKLTEEWRKAHPDVEPASELVKRILAERRAKWRGKGNYREPEAPDVSNLPELPKGWCWIRLEQLSFIFGGFTKNPQRNKLPRKLPYLRVANVYANELRLDEIEEIGVGEDELDKLILHSGDLLVVEGNGSKDQIGRLAIWDGSISPCVHQNHIIKVRLLNIELGKWILFWLLSLPGRNFVEEVASSTSGLYTLSVNKVASLPILLPPFAEQRFIVEEVERRLSVNEELTIELEANLKRVERLRQSILQRAFSGTLLLPPSRSGEAQVTMAVV